MNARRRIWAVAIALTLLGLALTLPRLGDSGLWDPWEPVYAQAAREMSERGDWIVPFHRDQPRVNRPPVTYWLIGASHAVFGVSEFAARLPMALLALLCPLGLGLAFAVRGRPWVGFMCGAVLLTSPQWLLLGRFATLSMPLAASLGLLLALVIGWPALETPGRRRWALAAIVVLLTVAGLTNWPRGLLLPIWAVLGWAALERPRGSGGFAFLVIAAAYHAGQLLYWPWLVVLAFVAAAGVAGGFLVANARLPARVVIGCGLIVAALLLPWFVAISQVPGEMKLMNYKYALNLGESPGDHTGPYSFVLRTLAMGSMPWIAAAVFGIAQGLRRRPTDDADEASIVRLLTGALLGTFAFFILAEPRMGHFTVMLQPAVASLAAIGLAAVVSRRDGTRLQVAACGVAVLTLAAVAWITWDSPSRVLETATVRRYFDSDAVVPWLLGGCGAWLLVVAIAAWRRSSILATAAVLPAALVAGTLALHTVPTQSDDKSTRALWEAYAADRTDGEPLGLLGPTQASLFYYSNNAIVRIDGEEELRAFLDTPGRCYFVVEDSMLEGLEHFPMLRSGHVETISRSNPFYTLVRYTPPAARPLF